MRRTRFTLLALAALIGPALLGGCSGGGLAGFNPFSKKEVLLAGERQSVLVEEGMETATGSPLIGSALSTDWPQPGGTAANAPGHASLGGGGAVAWRASTGGPGRLGVRSSAPPVIDGGRVYVYDASGLVSAFSTNGGRLWQVSVAKEKSRSPGGGVASGGSQVYVASGYGEIVALDAATGKRVWAYAMREPARSAPTVAGGKVYAVSARNILYAVNAGDGTEAWSYAGIAEREGVLGVSSPAVSGDTVVVPYSSGEVIAFDAGTGKPKWNDAVIRSSRTLAVSGLKEVAASPIVSDGMVYATGIAGRTIAVALSSGERVWEAPFGSSSTPAVSGNALFAIDLTDRMVALDKKTGKAFWTTQLPVVKKKRFQSVWSGPTLAGGFLWAVSNDGRMIAVDPRTGEIAREGAAGGPALSKPVAAGGRLYVITRDGALTAYQ